MNKVKNMRKRRGGFTLIELIVVIAILAIIALIAIPKFMKFQENARLSADKADAKNIHTITSTLLADEVLTAPTGATEVVKVSTDNTTGTAITKNLDSVPTIKSNKNGNYKGKEFYVSIASTGSIRVWNHSNDTDKDKEIGVTDGLTSASGILYPYVDK